jgi:aminoglycoside 6'-N-acetyltransferase I
MIEIRPLCESDRLEWLRLRSALWPEDKAADLESEMDEIAARPGQAAVFVAQRSSGGLCGMMEVSIRDRAEGCRTQHVGYIEGWYVDPDVRRQGVGGRLVAAAEDWARAQGCQEMGSDTNSDYPLSPLAHQALGYQEVKRCIHFRKDLVQQNR